jgi:hypothetical protein
MVEAPTAIVVERDAGYTTLPLRLPAAKSTTAPLPSLPSLIALLMASLIKVEGKPPPQELLSISAPPVFHAQSIPEAIHEF